MSRVRELLERTRADVEARKREKPELQIPGDDRRVRWDSRRFCIIAEIKRSSLSAGAIRPGLDVASLARSYEAAGASAISVLTEPHFFGGSLRDLQLARQAAGVPLLQKDFVIDAFQIREAKAHGASFILLIARFLTSAQLQELVHACRELRMNPLVEITDENDLEKIPDRVEFLGVNARNLETLEVDTTKFATLRPKLPQSFLIAESGIRSHGDLRRVIELGYHGALIGEHLLRAPDPGAELASLVRLSSNRPRIKVCGITNERDAMLAVEEGADALGFIFAESPRKISAATLDAVRSRIPSGALCVGVFLGQSTEEITEAAQRWNLHVAQIYDDASPLMPIWKARRFNGEAVSAPVDMPLLWDVKMPDSEMPGVWKRLSNHPVFALAGGLTPENVTDAVEICRPVWVDVARGVEMKPGIKDPTRLREFIKVLR